MNRTTALLVAGALLATSACSGTGGQSTSPASAPGTPAAPVAAAPTFLVAAVARESSSADPKPAADAIDAFGAALYRQIAAGAAPLANLAVSPASVGLALAMVRPGARGTTATEMDAVLHGLGGDATSLASLNALTAALASRTGTVTDLGVKFQPRQVTLRVTDAAFVQAGSAIEPAYLDALARSFGAGVNAVDFARDPEAARAALNAWASGQTDGRIPAIAAPGSITAETLLALANAIFLKAPWENQFDTAAPQAFARPDGTTVSAPMMRTYISEGRYAEGTGWRAADLPYAGGTLAMTVIIPDELAAFETGLDGAALAAITKALDDHPLDLTMPTFSLAARADLRAALTAMGLRSAFDSATADLSGIANRRLAISSVAHEARIAVDERGTEAVASTVVAIPASIAPGEEVCLTVDGSFLFAVRDVATGAILFLGRVADPTARD